jgi:hypothetical protein
MQTAPRPDDDWDRTDDPQEVPENPAMAEYAARRCHICQCRFPPFGFGPLTSKNGASIWACQAHRVEVGRLLTGDPVPRERDAQQRLL